ncbi:MAG: hypothetical protein IPK69_12580 [Phycisphaerales bacterium]|nr:MAG: hypothetical protein IPK69_12580 [Phycisphaerales bacterium]
MAHALVVGGTGMLRGLCLALASRGHGVSVIAQRHGPLQELAREAEKLPGSIHPIALDYGYTHVLERGIVQATTEHGPISLAACWIHSDAPQALPTLGRVLSSQAASRTDTDLKPTRVFVLVGSMAADPALIDESRRHEATFPALQWRRVILGFKTDGPKTRWLTHDEIWHGTLDAIDHDWSESIVGIVRPWAKRPR